MRTYHTKIKEKTKEAFVSVTPVVGIVLILCFSIAPIQPAIILAFLVGAAFLIMGMMLFSLGSDLSMSPMGEYAGTAMTKSKRLWLIIIMSFILGFIITISEPDLQVLANLVPSVPNMTLILAVAVGVGIFLVIALLRMLFSIPLSYILITFYMIAFLLTAFVPADFLGVAFDSGGVTTGPMTVPFIMALGIGISAIRSDRHAADDSFGLVALCSIGPIISVLVLGMIYHPQSGDYTPVPIPEIQDTVSLWKMFSHEIPHYMLEIAVSLLPIVIFFAILQMATLKLAKRKLLRIIIGLIYTYCGLVLFLTGANVGFMPAGNYLGQILVSLPYQWIIIPLGMLIGFFIVKAEPAVHILTKQVEELTDGAISAGAIGSGLSVSVACSVGLAMLRVLTGISIMWFLIPGYILAIGLSFFVPKIFTAIAFDSGGVASGPMTATFLLPLAQGACIALGGNIVTDAFGVVAMVAMTPLITLQVMGLIYRIKSHLSEKKEKLPQQAVTFEALPDNAIIEL